jgi:hypothetical protein
MWIKAERSDRVVTRCVSKGALRVDEPLATVRQHAFSCYRTVVRSRSTREAPLLTQRAMNTHLERALGIQT